MPRSHSRNVGYTGSHGCCSSGPLAEPSVADRQVRNRIRIEANDIPSFQAWRLDSNRGGRRPLVTESTMPDDNTTAVVQRYLDALAGPAPAEPIIRDLLARAVCRLHHLCASILHRSFPRLTRPPLNLQTDELLGAVV